MVFINSPNCISSFQSLIFRLFLISLVMATHIDGLQNITPEKETWRIKVRVLRLWVLPSFNNPKILNSIEMVLMDEAGSKIHASVRKTLVYKFKPLLIEGKVYVMTYFGVGGNIGYFRTTRHEYRLNFQLRTSVKASESVEIPLFGFSFVPLDDIFHTDVDLPYLVDVIGMLSAVGTEKEYEKEGKKTKMNVIEIEVDGLKIECALFGTYVDELNSFLATGDINQAVVIIQFAKVKRFKGKIVLQNVMYATRLLFNLDIQEVIDFKKNLPEAKAESSQMVAHLSDASSYSLEDDFLKFTNRKSIEQLKDCKEDGFCVIKGTVKHVVKGEDWWYTACKCNKAVCADSGMYYCDACYCHVLNVFPRYRIKLRVIDESDSATFVIFDRDATILLRKSCSEMIEQMQKSSHELSFPKEIEDLVEKSFLFKIEIKSSSSSHFEPSYRVRRLTDDLAILKKFSEADVAISPKEVVVTAGISVSEVNASNELQDVESGIQKDLLSQFCDNATDLDYGDALTPAKRSHDDSVVEIGADMSTNKLKKAIKLEKD